MPGLSLWDLQHDNLNNYVRFAALYAGLYMGFSMLFIHLADAIFICVDKQFESA